MVCILQNRIISPFFIEGTLNGLKYADFLSQQLLDEVLLKSSLQMWYISMMAVRLIIQALHVQFYTKYFRNAG